MRTHKKTVNRHTRRRKKHIHTHKCVKIKTKIHAQKIHPSPTPGKKGKQKTFKTEKGIKHTETEKGNNTLKKRLTFSDVSGKQFR